MFASEYTRRLLALMAFISRTISSPSAEAGRSGTGLRLASRLRLAGCQEGTRMSFHTKV
jgi:hypothetical protein